MAAISYQNLGSISPAYVDPILSRDGLPDYPKAGDLRTVGRVSYVGELDISFNGMPHPPR
jgi:hypothetical protein